VLCILCFLILTVGLPTASSVVLAQTKGQGPTPQYGGTYRRPLSNNPSTLDPAAVSDTNAVTVVQQIFDGLVQYDNSLSIAPALAETWKSSRDNLVWTFYLRKGVKFPTVRKWSP
jgi:peptide/nickel transport system substrate-binding protein